MFFFTKKYFALCVIWVAISGNDICCIQSSSYEKHSFEKYDRVEDSEVSDAFDNPYEAIKKLFTEMEAAQFKNQRAAKKEAAEKREKEMERVKLEADASAMHVDLEVMPVATEQLPKEMDVVTAEKFFIKCLMKNRRNPVLGRLGIPKACEDSARVLRLVGGSFEADELIEAFRK